MKVPLCFDWTGNCLREIETRLAENEIKDGDVAKNKCRVEQDRSLIIEANEIDTWK